MKTMQTIWGPGRMGGDDFCGINHIGRRSIHISRIVNGKVEFEILNRD
jgi:hypothetical protein